MKNNTINEVVLLAGGLGQRLRRISKGKPKPLMKIYKNFSILDLIITKLKKYKFKIFLTVHYKKKLFIKKYKNEKNITIITEKIPLGTGGAIKNCLKKIKQDSFLVINCDTLSNINYSDFINFYNNKNISKKILIGGSYVKNTDRFGKLKIDKDNLLKGFYEKKLDSKKGWINNGSYILSKKFLDKKKGKFSFEDSVLSIECLKDNVFVYKVYRDNFIDIGIPIDYEKALKIYNKE